MYRANVDAVNAYFGSFDPRKGTARSWVFGIARHVYATYCEKYSQQQDKLRRLAGRRELDRDQVGELLERIDAERAGRDMLTELATLPERDRTVIELWTSRDFSRRKRRQCSGSRRARNSLRRWGGWAGYAYAAGKPNPGQRHFSAY
jgi:hypothetical protein